MITMSELVFADVAEKQRAARANAHRASAQPWVRDGLAHIANGSSIADPACWHFFCYWADKNGLTEKPSRSCDLRFLTLHGEELLRDLEDLLG
jgi:hypothetical protein